ncbi:MAG TPA: PEPxxWA-CTERM sorting domain-containing protein [Sphingomonas sp.]|nr:PEPxxWA-CTERM sorting domain-containing protein [Sphingomonas sp.]
MLFAMLSAMAALLVVVDCCVIGGSIAGNGVGGPSAHPGVRLDGAVPEPAFWALILGGFGVIGGAMRGGRKLALNFS